MGAILNEYLEYDTTATFLFEAAEEALGAVIAKRRHLSDLGFKTFEKLFCSGVVHRFTAIPVVRGEVGWSKTRSDRWLSMICYV